MGGKLADRTGRKPMLLRASIGMTITATLTGFSTSVWMLISLRFIQGMFSGYINNAFALIASEVPQKQSGKTMGGTLTTGSVGGAISRSHFWRLYCRYLGGLSNSILRFRWINVLGSVSNLFWSERRLHSD